MLSLMTVWVLSAVVVGPELERCRLGGAVFRTEKLGFIPDACGEVFVTKDGGITWAPTRRVKRDAMTFRSLSLGGAFADGSVVMGGYFGSSLLRTTDDGATWKEVSVPTSAWLYSMVTRGTDAWSCGSASPLIHSADSGRTWTAVKVPTNSEDRCISLDFLDGKRGWVGGWYGSLWATEDGGESWKKVALPPEFTPTEPNERTLSRVLRVTAALGFVRGNRGTYRTRDGGATWELLALPETAPRRLSKLGAHRVLVTAESATKPPDQQLVDLAESLVPRGDGAVSVSEDGLNSWASDGTRRVLGVCGPASGEQPRLGTHRVTGALRSAFGTKHAFLSRDEGATWREVSALPDETVFEQFVMVDAERALAKSAGKLFRSDDAGRDWSETTSPLDAMDLAKALGTTEEPLSCLLGGTTGQVTLTFGVQGCFGGNSSELTLTWTASGGELHVRYDELRERKDLKKHLAPGEVRTMLEQLHERATRTEETSHCQSTTRSLATLDVSCTVAAKSERQTVKTESNDCGTFQLEPGVGGATSSGVPSGYARAAGLQSWALGL